LEQSAPGVDVGHKIIQHPSNMKTRSNTHFQSGFTLIELLVVIVIISILASLTFPVTGAIMRSVRNKVARTDCSKIALAIQEYYTAYDKLPFSGGGGADKVVEADSTIIKALLGEDDSLNPRGINFLSARPSKMSGGEEKSGLTDNGVFLDLWGEPYRILLDLDYDKKLQMSELGYSSDGGASILRRRVAVCSYGEDKDVGKKGNGILKGSDDAASWQ